MRTDLETPADPTELGGSIGVLGWIVAASFFLAAVLFALIEFEVIVDQPPTFGPDFVQNIRADGEYQRTRWPEELTANLLFTVGFASLAGLGLAMGRRLGRAAGGAPVGGLLALAGGLGMVSQLVFIGVKETAIDSQICDCRYLAAQLIARTETLRLAERAQEWLLAGFASLAAVGFFLLATALARRDPDSPGLAWLTWIVGGVLALTALTLIPGLEETVFEIVVLVGAGILLPVWAIWIARRSSRWGSVEEA